MNSLSSSLKPGRRRFDRDEALETAMKLFWRHGYEATSMADLLKAMGLTAPSLYSAFGNKEQLFLEAVQRYASIYGTQLFQSLYEDLPVRSAIEHMLQKAVESITSARNPAGCLVTCGTMNCSEDSASVVKVLRDLRVANEKRIRDRLVRAVKDKELPATTNPARLAKYFTVVMGGMQLQSRDGASKKELEAVAEDAMEAWPC